MHILSGLSNDHAHQLNAPGAYEWWYADALDAGGEWGVVMILFRGMPMSPDYLAEARSMTGGYALSVYYRGVRIAFAFGGHPLQECRFDVSQPGVSMPSGALECDPEGISMHVDAPCGTDGRRARVNLRMTKDTAPLVPSETHTEGHAWVLASARTSAQVSIQIDEAHGPVVRHDFAGIAYHDHNMGSRAMPMDYHDWYWGRCHGRDATYVFLLTRRSVDNVTWFGRVTSDGRVEELDEVSIKFSRRRISMLGLIHHRRIRLRGRDRSGHVHEVICSNDTVCEDGPFYQRYISSWRINGDESALGTSEYMNVQRLAQPWIRPFLRLPWMVSS